MECPKCDTELEPGQALMHKDYTDYVNPMTGGNPRACFWTPPPLNADNIALGYCLKCPKCGHSESDI